MLSLKHIKCHFFFYKSTSSDASQHTHWSGTHRRIVNAWCVNFTCITTISSIIMWIRFSVIPRLRYELFNSDISLPLPTNHKLIDKRPLRAWNKPSRKMTSCGNISCRTCNDTPCCTWQLPHTVESIPNTDRSHIS